MRQKAGDNVLVLSILWDKKHRHYKLFQVPGKGYSIGGDSQLYFPNPVRGPSCKLNREQKKRKRKKKKEKEKEEKKKKRQQFSFLNFLRSLFFSLFLLYLPFSWRYCSIT